MLFPFLSIFPMYKRAEPNQGFFVLNLLSKDVSSHAIASNFELIFLISLGSRLLSLPCAVFFADLVPDDVIR